LRLSYSPPLYFRSTEVVTFVCLLQILIGNAYYNCSCVLYVTSDVWVLYVSIAAGALGVIIIIIIIIVVACRRCRNKPKERTEERPTNNDHCCENAAAGSVELDEDDRYYCSIPAAESNDNATNEYCRPLPAQPGENDPKEYSTLGPPETTNNNNSPYYLELQGDDNC